MNTYPQWKYILIIFVIALSCLYAAPNLYGDDPAVQISMSNDVLTQRSVDEVAEILADAHIAPTAPLRIEKDRIVVRVANDEQQNTTKELLERKLDDKIYTVALNLAPATPTWLRQLGANPMYLGLDLRGGIHFLLQVDMDSAVETVIQSYASEIRPLLRQEKVRTRGTRTSESALTVRFNDDAERQRGKKILGQKYPDLAFEERQDGALYELIGTLTPAAINAEKKLAIKQNVTALRNRVNALGVSEPIIQQQGLDRIVVQLPGVQDSAKAREILGSTATLEYRMQYGDLSQAAEAARTGRVPPQAKLFQHREGFPVLLSNDIIVTGDNIQNASVSRDENGSPAVSITLDGKGAERMLKNTKANINKPMAVVFKEITYETREVNGEPKSVSVATEQVVSIATINGVFSKNFQTTGLSKNEASRLALLLRAGALKAPMEIIEERTVGPSLGKDNIDKGKMSVVAGMLVVLVFMALYYRGFGLIANLALVTNLIIILAVMSLLQATLTLPGIAGIVLTVGMAVDANILIFERIREELRAGAKVQSAIHLGYDRAFSTIADSNITTLITGALLFSFGTGPIKGFAVTLCIGILSSMFTAIMGTRAIVNLIYGKRRVDTISIGCKKQIAPTKDHRVFHFMKRRYLALGLSAVLVIGSLVGLATRGLQYGVDFTGGYLIELGYPQTVSIEPIRQQLASGGFEDALVQHFGSSHDVMVRLPPKNDVTSSEMGKTVIALLQQQNPDVELHRIDFVGPQVGEELRDNGGLALLFAMLAIVAYVAMRFQYKFSFGAVLALMHDVIVVLGVFAYTRIEFDLTVLAAILAVIGYSINDTIVIFDRIREYFRTHMRGAEPTEVIDAAVSSTLSRTIMTSLSTMLVLVSLYFLGGSVIHSFALTLLVGIGVGTYSSIFVASSLLVSFKLTKADMLELNKEKLQEGVAADGSQP